MEGATEEDRAAINEMLGDLNDLLEKHSRGEDTDEDFADFMDKHGDFFPENPQNIDELMDTLAERSAAAQRMLNSMTPEQRAELMELSQQAFGSPELMQQLARMDANLQSLRPDLDWGSSEEFGGEQGLGLGDGTGVFQDLAELDALADQLSQSYGGARMDDVDLDALARQLGDQAAVDARTLSELEKALRDSATSSAVPTASCASRRRRCASSARRCCATSPTRMSGRQGQRESAQRRIGRRALRGDPGVGVRRHRAVGRDAHDHQRGPAHGGTAVEQRARRVEPGCVSASTTSRSRRPRSAPRRRSPCSSTRPSRWRWTAAGCR